MGRFSLSGFFFSLWVGFTSPAISRELLEVVSAKDIMDPSKSCCCVLGGALVLLLLLLLLLRGAGRPARRAPLCRPTGREHAAYGRSGGSVGQQSESHAAYSWSGRALGCIIQSSGDGDTRGLPQFAPLAGSVADPLLVAPPLSRGAWARRRRP